MQLLETHAYRLLMQGELLNVAPYMTALCDDADSVPRHVLRGPQDIRDHQSQSGGILGEIFRYRGML